MSVPTPLDPTDPSHVPDLPDLPDRIDAGSHEELAARLGGLLGRRAMLRAAAAGALGTVGAGLAQGSAAAAPAGQGPSPVRVLQPGSGRVRGRYVPPT